MSVIINGTDGVTFNDSSLQGAAASPYVIKNRIINGDMRIDQRNAGASVTPVNNVGGSGYTLDRWYFSLSQASKLTSQQNAASVTPPSGYINYLGCTSSSAYSVGASEVFLLRQSIEGLNVSDLDWGLATAKTVTLSFWVRSSLTGTFGGSVLNNAGTRFYPFSYTISAANTWEQKSVTIAGDTSGTWLTTNGVGINLSFSLGSGSTLSGTAGSWSSSIYYSATGATSVVGTNGATWYVTGVQLEQNTSATPFERRLYNQELANCQRYYEKSFDIGTAPANGPNATSLLTIAGFMSTVAGNNNLIGGPCRFAVAKRVTPTMTAYGNNSGYWAYIASSASASPTYSASAMIFSGEGTGGFCVAQNVTNNVYYTIQGHWTASSEL
jgi:hypothetical protein